MMKNLRKNALVSLVIILAILLLLSRTVGASQELLLFNTTSENQTENTIANEVENSVQ